MGQGLQATVLGQTVQVAPKVKLEVCFLPLSILHFDSTLAHPPFPSPGEVLERVSVEQDLSRCHFPQGFILGLKTTWHGSKSTLLVVLAGEALQAKRLRRGREGKNQERKGKRKAGRKRKRDERKARERAYKEQFVVISLN